MDREDERAAPRIVVEDHFGRRIGENPAIPIEFSVDAHGWERRWQRTGRHDVLYCNFAIAAVEVAHHAGTYLRRADGETGRASIDDREVDQIIQCLAQRLGGVETGAIDAKRDVRAEKSRQVGPEEPG